MKLVLVLAWFTVTICTAIATPASEYAILGVGFIALIFFVLWTISVYELKMEYVFNKDYSLAGYVVAVDRVILNLSSLIFVLAIPPERFIGDRVSGRLFTFLVGGLFMLIGVILVLTIRNKRKYLRMEFEQQKEEEKEEKDEEEGETKGEVAGEEELQDVKIVATEVKTDAV